MSAWCRQTVRRTSVVKSDDPRIGELCEYTSLQVDVYSAGLLPRNRINAAEVRLAIFRHEGECQVARSTERRAVKS